MNLFIWKTPERLSAYRVDNLVLKWIQFWNGLKFRLWMRLREEPFEDRTLELFEQAQLTASSSPGNRRIRIYHRATSSPHRSRTTGTRMFAASRRTVRSSLAISYAATVETTVPPAWTATIPPRTIVYRMRIMRRIWSPLPSAITSR